MHCALESSAAGTKEKERVPQTLDSCYRRVMLVAVKAGRRVGVVLLDGGNGHPKAAASCEARDEATHRQLCGGKDGKPTTR